MWRRTLIQSLVLVVGGLAGGVLLNVARGAGGLGLVRPVRAAAEAGACTASAPDVAQISLEEAARLRLRHDVAFADTRSPEEYAKGHIAGAQHVPCFGSQETALASLAHLASIRTLILYGQQESDPQVALAAQALAQRGREDVRILQGGWQAWQAASLPAESGPCPTCEKP